MGRVLNCLRNLRLKWDGWLPFRTARMISGARNARLTTRVIWEKFTPSVSAISFMVESKFKNEIAAIKRGSPATLKIKSMDALNNSDFF